MRSICSIDGCGGVVKGLGLCNKHRIRLKLTGTTDDGPRAQAPIGERFWKKVDRRSDDECWPWTGPSSYGYGRLSVGKKSEGYVLAHRYSCALHHGGSPHAGGHVMHLCDNRGCVNPAHLRWGTAAENIQDAYDKKRKVSPFKLGEKHHMAKVNVTQVKFIKANPHMRVSELVRLLGCSRGVIDGIRKGVTWKHVALDD